jgi:hypothetical protein
VCQKLFSYSECNSECNSLELDVLLVCSTELSRSAFRFVGEVGSVIVVFFEIRSLNKYAYYDRTLPGGLQGSGK